MLRRFEIYKVRDDVPKRTVVKFESILRDCGRFIPQVLHSAVGRNLSRANATMVWEHAYESPATYEQYMRHPYHACILDRYLLHDNPERITEDNGLQCGLVGYEVEGPAYYMAGGVRRIVLLSVRPGTGPDDVRRLEAWLRNAPKEAPQMRLSVVGQNSMGSAWRPSIWSHVWEQGFRSLGGLQDYLQDGSSLARAERSGWRDAMGGIIQRSVDFHYRPGKPR